MTDVARPLELECGHVMWLIIYPESLEEMLYCRECKAYVEIAPAAGKLLGAWVIHADEEFRSKRTSKLRYIGECSKEDCNETVTKKSWFKLRDHFHSHYARQHTRFGPLVITEDRKPDKAWTRKDAPPPF